MNILSETLLDLQKNLQTLPGIGEKTAQRLAYFIVNQPESKAILLANAIEKAIKTCKPCSDCYMLSDINPCPICSDKFRNSDILCVVESSRDVFAIENTKEFNGYYFVLGNLLSPINGIGPNEIRFKELCKFIEKRMFNELILALSPSTEGETTMQFIANNILITNSNSEKLKITRLSTGIPYGCDMEFTASSTLLNALKRRFTILN